MCRVKGARPFGVFLSDADRDSILHLTAFQSSCCQEVWGGTCRKERWPRAVEKLSSLGNVDVWRRRWNILQRWVQQLLQLRELHIWLKKPLVYITYCVGEHNIQIGGQHWLFGLYTLYMQQSNCQLLPQTGSVCAHKPKVYCSHPAELIICHCGAQR